MVIWNSTEGEKPEGRVLLALKTVNGDVRCMITGKFSKEKDVWFTDSGSFVSDESVMGWTLILYPDGEAIK